MKKNKKNQIQKDLAAAKHGMYDAMKDAGVLVNGHMTPRGFRVTDKKKENSKKACRQKVED